MTQPTVELPIVRSATDAVALIRQRASQEPSDALRQRQSLDDSHVRYGKALLSAMADDIERRQGEELGDCELCGKPLALGQFVNQYDDVGAAHANCDAPFAKPREETPSPSDDGETMTTYVLLGEPTLLESIGDPQAALIKEAVEALTPFAHYAELNDLLTSGDPERVIEVPVRDLQRAYTALSKLTGEKQ